MRKSNQFIFYLQSRIDKEIIELAFNPEYCHTFENPTAPKEWWYNDFIIKSEKIVESTILNKSVGIKKKDITRNFIKTVKSSKDTVFPLFEYSIKKYKLSKMPAIVTSPGKTLSDKIQEMGISVEEFAEKSELPVEYIKNLIDDGDEIILWSAGQLQKATGIPAHFWMNSQEQYNLWVENKL